MFIPLDLCYAIFSIIFIFRTPVILEDRDLTGELKDIWLTIQAKRERDKMSTMEHLPNANDTNVLYEEFGPRGATVPAEGSSHENVSSSQETATTSTTTTEAVNDIKINDLKISDVTDSKNELQPPSPSKLNVENSIDFSINPFLVPYPEIDCLVKIVMDSLDQNSEVQVANNKTDTDQETETKLKQIVQESQAKHDDDKHKSKEPETLPQSNNEKKDGTEKQTQQNQQMETFKKSIEFLTNGCHNFFLFKSKSSQDSGSGKKKSKKEKRKNDEKKSQEQQCGNGMLRVQRNEEGNSDEITVKS